MKLRKEDFNAGSPYSSWLKEELTGAIQDYPENYQGRNLVRKHHVRVTKNTEWDIMCARKLDDLPKEIKSMAIEIIRRDLDSSFSG